MQLTNKEKIKMCLEHLNDGKSLTHKCERYNYTDVSKLKYWINLYKKHGEDIFIERERRIYRRDSKILAISRVKNGESIRSVSIDLGLTEPAILGDWIKLYDTEGEQRIQDTYPRKSYLNKDERYKETIDTRLKEENKRLKAEIEFLKKSQSLAQKLEDLTTKQKVEVVRELRTKFDLKVLLEIANIPRSVYYYQTKSIDNKINKYKELEEKIDVLYLKKHKKRIGYQRIYIELKKEGYVIGKNKILEIMRIKNYTKQKKSKYYNSYEGDLGGVVENVLNRNFRTTKPYEKAGTDVTMFSIKDDRVYLSPIIDFNSREVLSYEVGTDAKVVKIMSMLDKLKSTHKGSIKGLILQSDQGVQYQNSRYSNKLKELGIIQSMSRKGNCLDNSPTENFFGRMKNEMWYNKEDEYETTEDLIKGIHEYIKYYNEVRIVTKLKSSPIDYRNRILNSL